MIESIEKPQESIRKNRNPHRVIPAQAGIQEHNRRRGSLTGKNHPPTRHSRAGGNPKRNATGIIGKTETSPTVSSRQKR
ncbi:hypothetical protein, partial [Neisseria meningitidis]|uniref:hypothetical protein n=1 Tax=Neisseria meningitidis TaxID=487 RepID=UPI001E4AD6C8